MEYILFICRANISRSQMAQAMFNHFKKNHPEIDKNYEAISAGMYPFSYSSEIEGNGVVNTYLSRHAEILGIDISDPAVYHPKMITEEMLCRSKIRIALSSSVESSNLFGYKVDENWSIPDRLRHRNRESDEIREQIKERVLNLIKNLYGEEKFA